MPFAKHVPWKVICWFLLASTFLSPPSLPGDEIQSSDLIQRLNWVRFELVQGRITTRDTRQGQNRSATVTNEKKQIREEVSLKIVAGSPVFEYDYQDRLQNIHMELVNNHQLVIKRSFSAQAAGTSIEFHQPQRGPLQLVIFKETKPVSYQAPHLWQLILEQPDVCRDHLYPLLHLLRSDWQFEQWLEKIETNLVRMASYQTQPAYDQLQRLIDQLDAPSFRVRQSADRHLRGMGKPVVSYLRQLNTDNMTSEQRLRIRRICQSLTTRNGDTPEAVTAWLLSNPHIWIILMKRKEADVRIVAHRQLNRLLQQQVPFDPRAPAAEREIQLGHIESTVLPR